MTSVDNLDVLINAAYPILFVVGHEEDRVEAAIKQIVERRNPKLGSNTDVWIWSITQGAYSPNRLITKKDVADPIAVLDWIEGYAGTAVFVLRDYGHFLSEGPAYTVQRKLKDLASSMATKGEGSTIVIVDSVVEIPPRIEKIVTLIDFDLPSATEMASKLLPVVAMFPSMTRLPEDELWRIVMKGSEAAAGLTLAEAENVFAKSLTLTNTIDPTVIIQDKKSIIRKSGVLEYYDVMTNMQDVGGLENLKVWLDQRGRAFSKEAHDFGLPTPKGVLLVGVPGTGKSLTAKCIGAQWNMPVLRMDIGALFGSLVGQSEHNMRKALKTAEAMAPCVLWIDEIEKSMGSGGGTLDGGTTSRVFGNFLSWMQDKTAPVFVVATANDVSSLPPEMLRKGRFDELFFSDLPTPVERRNILEIHVKRMKRDPSKFNLARLATKAQNFSGAELSQLVIDGLYAAFQQGRDLEEQDLDSAMDRTVPLYDTMTEKVEALRSWAKGRATPANRDYIEVPKAQERTRTVTSMGG